MLNPLGDTKVDENSTHNLTRDYQSKVSFHLNIKKNYIHLNNYIKTITELLFQSDIQI